jgi:hypothetical protein
MVKKSIIFLILLAMVLAIGAQTIDRFQVPTVGAPGASGDKCPSIATNSRGDLMVVFRNRDQSIMYYFIKKSNGAVTQTRLPGSKDRDILWTSVVATSDDNFHAVWGVLIGDVGVFYADFNIASETWTAPEQLYSQYPEDQHLRANPVNDDIVMCTVLRSVSLTKNIYVKFRKNGQTTWTNEINVSNIPEGSATNPYAHFDDQGYLYVTWKEDREPDIDELIIKVALIKKDASGNYTLVDKQWATSNYTGWHFLPTIAMTGTKGIITFTWQQQGGYYYLPFERSGDKLVFDQKNLTKIVDAPKLPHFLFHSKAIAHGDEIMFVYLDMQHKMQLLRWKDGLWIDSQPITLENNEINKWPFNLWADPNIGLLTTWYTEADNGDGSSFYCIYNYPKPTIRPPVNITFLRTMERNFFHGYWMFGIRWADNPYNIEKKITVVKFNIYRRIHWSSDKWLLVGSVAGTVFAFADRNGITPSSDFEYAVTAVNQKNIESRIQ